MNRHDNLPDRQLVLEDFAGKVGDSFTLREADLPAIAMKLAEAEALNAAIAPRGMRPPFSLVFQAADPRVLPQRIYRLAHGGLGEVSIFLVPIGKDANGVSYQATFN